MLCLGISYSAGNGTICFSTPDLFEQILSELA
jgi:hypothetical protein